MRVSYESVGLMRPLSLIVAVDEHGGFAKDGTIPWIEEEFAKDDLKHFKKVTDGAACIMGRRTYLDMYDLVIARKTKGKKPSKKPVRIDEILPGRECYVVSRTMEDAEGATVVQDMRHAVEQTSKREIFAIGGERIYHEALPWVNKIYMTIVPGIYECDKDFPVKFVHRHFKVSHGEQVGPLKFIEYVRR